MPAPISFLCTNPKHAPSLLVVGGYVTINEGAWAFCPSAGLDQHRWQPIAPTSLGELIARGPSAFSVAQAKGGDGELLATVEPLSDEDRGT